jgi:hypothetical protein
MKSAYRIYSEYLDASSREEAERIVRKAADISCNHLMRLAPHFGEDYGRLPDELHNMVVLTGGDQASKYIERFEVKVKEG